MSEFKLKPIERDDLVAYAKFLRETLGLQPELGMRVQLEARTRGREIRALVGRPAQTVTLGWWEDDMVDGVCTCAAESDCVHCLVLAEHLVPVQEASKGKVIPAASSTTARIRSVLKRPLSKEERAYVDQMEAILRTVGFYTRMTVHQVYPLAVDPPKSPGYEVLAKPVEPPTPPKDAIELWHAARRALAAVRLRTPAFMEEVATAFPPPPVWVEAWRQEDVKVWMERLRKDANSLSLLQPWSKVTEPPWKLRCVHTLNGLEVEWAPVGTEEWTPFKRTSFQRTFLDNAGEPTRIAPESELLAEIIRRYGDAKRLRSSGRDEYFDSGAILLAILHRPSLHSSLHTTKGIPYRFEGTKLAWHVFEPVEGAADYELEIRMADGSPLPPGSQVAKYPHSMDGFLITPEAVWKLPPIPPAMAGASSNRIPGEVLRDETALRLMVNLGAKLPASLESLIERVPGRLRYRFGEDTTEREASGTGSAEFARFTAEVTDPDGKAVMKWSNGNWEPASRRRGKDARVRIIESENLPDPTSLGSELGAKAEGSALAVRLTRGFPEKFAAWARSLPEGVELDLPPLLQSILADPVTATVSLKCDQAGVDWFDLSLEITPENTDLTPEELRLLLAARGGYVRLGTRGWMRARFNLSEEDAAQLSALGLDPSEASAEPQRLHTLHLAAASTRKLLPPEREEQVLRRQSELKTTVQPPVPSALRADLRPYQIEGFHFLAYLVENGFGGVLADDMGLGKTVQTLAWIAWLRARATGPAADGVVPTRILIVCPKSVAPNWKAESQRFLPELRLGVWGGQPETEFVEVLGQVDALVVNYAQMRGLEESLGRQEWLAVILDEAQAIKNPDSQTAKVARSLKARYRVALTGTPIENRLLDLWSIFAFAMPGVLGIRAKFQRHFAKMGDALARQRLATRVRPFLLRRTKGQVAQDLPPRIEEDVICELEGVQRDLYRAEYKKARAMLLGAASAEKFNDLKFHFLSSLTRLRQICCHPALVDAAQRTQPASKVEALIDLLEPLIEEGHKVLVFSQFATMLDLLQQEIHARAWTDFLLTGQTEDRGPLVDAFNAHPGAAVFLISLKAGGFGLNLTSASYVVLFDPWWNPAVEAQAIDRTHRIGQVQTVIAYRLIVKGSIEEKIRELQKAKAMMAGDTLGEDKFNQALTLDDFRFLFDSTEAAL
jgi:superfamily II DNA or RNA helicase